MKLKKMLLFDIDGTLLLTGGTGKVALEAALLELYGIPDSWGDLIPDGKTDPVIIDEICLRILGRNLSPEEHQIISDRYHDHFEREIEKASGYRLMPGIPELLSALGQRNDLAMGLATGNFEKAAFLKLQKGRLHHHFSFGGYASDSADRRTLTRIAYERGRRLFPEPVDPRHVLVIGDTIHDINAGKALGAVTVSVGTGSTPATVLRALEPDFYFEDLSETARFLALLD